MKIHTPATIEDLYQIEGKAELVDGEIVYMTPTGDAPSRASLRICISLGRYEDETGLGRTYPDNVGFVINRPKKRTFSPDAAFYTGQAASGVNMKFLEGAPIFAVEVRSENDYGRSAESEMAAKRADYFAAGTLVVWDVDLLSEDVVRVYRADSPTEPTIYRKGDMAEAEPALPGWKMPVDDLFR
jgi:Uma2 family endonuclease